MTFKLIQLSDIHLTTEPSTNSIMTRIDTLLGAFRGELSRGDKCIVVFSGDITNRGKKEEFDIAHEFLGQLYEGLKDHLDKSPIFIIIPGNHDHDFEHKDYDEQLRNIVIEASTPSAPPNLKTKSILFQPQEPFRQFIKNAQNDIGAYGVEDLFISHTINLEDESVRFLLLNSTMFTKKKEEAGKSWFPVEELTQYMGKHPSEGAVSIGVIHHPYNWLHPDNAIKLKNVLEDYCDVVITGHEHHSSHYLKVRKSTEQNLYIEGGVLQNIEQPDESTFNYVKIDTVNKSFNCKSIGLIAGIYEPITNESEHRFLRLRQLVRNNFELTNEWKIWIEQIGTDFQHPRKRNLNLSDLFVYPDLRKLDVKNACRPSGLVRDREVLGYIQEKRQVLIAGNEKTGKTSLCKSLFTDLREAGLVPIILRSEFAIKSPRNLSIEDRLHSAINSIVERIYTPSSASRFWQIPIEQRAILIDDFDRLSLSIGGRDSLLGWCNKNFGIVIVTADPGIRMGEILNRTIDDTVLWTYEHVDILESDRETRDALIHRWLYVGTDPFETSHEELFTDRVRYAQVIDALIGKGAMPSVPLFIFMMMQQLETRGSIENSSGLYGSLYELIIRDTVKGACSKISDVEVRLNYLSELAYYSYSIGRKHIIASDFIEWHDSYCDKYNLMLDCTRTIQQLRDIGVFRRNGDNVGFKYRYYYCYFLARYLSNNIHEKRIIDEVENLSRALYNNDAAQTMLFLCHLSKNPKILELILAAAKSHFTPIAKYSLLDTPKVLPDRRIYPTPLMISENSSPSDEREQSLRRQDDVDPPKGLKEVGDDSSDEPKGDESILRMINEANSAHHVIRICGQILRNFFGSIVGDIQIHIIRESYDLCLRMLSVLYEFLERDKEEIAGILSLILQHKYPELSGPELDSKTRAYMQFLTINICYSLIKHTSCSLGLSDLRPSFDKILSMPDISVSDRLLDLSARLDYFDGFPKDSITEVAKMLKGKGVGYEALRILVWEHMKLFNVPYDARQSICSQLEITIGQTAFINPKNKR